MTFAPGPAPETDDDIAAPRDPASYGPPRHLFSRGFIMVMVFGFVCIGLGVAFTLLVPRLFPAKDLAAAPAPAAQSYPTAPPPAAAAPLLAAPTTSAADVAALQARVAALESGQQRTVDAAAAALAAASLAEASQTARPFAAELAAAERVLPMSIDLQALYPLAQTGAPTRASLAASFDASAAPASVAAHEPGPKAGMIARILHFFAGIIVIRRVDEEGGSGPDAILARAGRLAAEGNLEGALGAIAALPPKAQAAFTDWRGKAQARIEIDRRIAAVRQSALSDLMQTTRGGR